MKLPDQMKFFSHLYALTWCICSLTLFLAEQAEAAPLVVAGRTAYADFNGDSRTDKVSVNTQNNLISLVLGNETGEWGSPIEFASGGEGPRSLAVGDLDQDGVPDVAVANQKSNSVSVLFSDGVGGFSLLLSFQVGQGPLNVAIGDFNNDGWTDFSTTNRNPEEQTLFLGDGTGAFDNTATARIGSSPSSPVIGASLAATSPTLTADAAPQTFAAAVSGPLVTSLSLNPANITGGSGSPSQGTLTLDSAAPAGGLVVLLASSNSALAAVPATVVVPENATTVSFAIGTNAKYRRYSGLAFLANIAASVNGSTTSATLSISAAPRPADILGDSTQREGKMCGGVIPASKGDKGILYQCFKGANFGTLGKCTFSLECSNGCQTKQPNGFKYSDACSKGPTPITVNPQNVVGGTLSSGAVALSSSAPSGGVQITLSNSMPAAATLSPSSFVIPAGSSQGAFSAGTTAQNSAQFVNIGLDALKVVNGFQGHLLSATWLTVTPP